MEETMQEEISSEVAETTAEQPEAEKVEAKETAAPKAPQKFKVKIDGKEVEASDDDIPEDERLLPAKQMSVAAQKRFAAAAEKERAVNAFIEAFKEDPKTALMAHAGMTKEQLLELAVAVAEEHMREEQMTPEQKEVSAARREAEEYKKRLAEYEQERQQRIAEEESAKYTDQYAKAFSSTLAAAELPDTPFARAVMSQYLINVMDNTYSGNLGDFDANFETHVKEAASVVEELLSGHEEYFTKKRTKKSSPKAAKAEAEEAVDPEIAEVAEMIRLGMRK